MTTVVEQRQTALPVLDCEGCGACCTHIGTPPGFAMFFGDWAEAELQQYPDYAIVQGMPKELRNQLRSYYRAVFVHKTERDRSGYDCPCLWYDERTRKCKHYEHRPTVCREFRVGCEGCLTHRRRVGIA